MKVSLYNFIIGHLKNHKFEFLVMIMVSFLVAAFSAVEPYLTKLIIDKIAQVKREQVFSSVAFYCILYVMANFTVSVFYRLYDYFVMYRMMPTLRKQMGSEILNKLLEQSYSFYQNNFSGSLANKINDLISNVPEILMILIDRMLQTFLFLSITIIMLWKVSSVFALAMCSWALLIIIGSLILANKISKLADYYSETYSAITGKIVDNLSNIISIRLFATKKREANYIDNMYDEAVLAERKLKIFFFWKWLIYGFTFVTLSAVNLYFLCKGYSEDKLSIGDFVLVLGLNISIANMLWEVARDFSQLASLVGKANQALRVIAEPIEVNDSKTAKELVVTKGEIEFDQVNFFYKNNSPLFDNKSIRIEAGEKVGLVGYSGSGKSTFVNLILRLFDVTSGKILIDGQNIKDVTQESLRKAVAMIPQDPSLFHRSLFENIAYGKEDASLEEITQAARKAHADEFITNLPEGYRTLVGERGIKLSGGQRQRIAIARAILKNAPILILDEATSQLDSLTEELIQESLETLMENKTTLIIAHRLSTLLKMDRILVFNNGKIVGDGTHKSLYINCALYKELWDSQIGGFIKDK